MTLCQNPIWYWPGIHCKAEELHTFFGVLQDAGFPSERVEATYDAGLLPDNASSGVQKWVNDPRRTISNWWIGLSLGAAVAHIAACTAPEHRRPKRLTLINPFADRMELSQHLGFPMRGQWRLKPIDFHCLGGIRVDLVLSMRDERIPPQHGKRFIDCYSAGDVALIEMDTNHAVTDESHQRLLASLLLSKN